MKQKRKVISRIICIFICLIIIICQFPAICFAEEKQKKTVRVAYALVPGYQEGGEGEYKTGYGYEYLQKLASINGWKYEYVYGSFSELLEKLKKGEVDLMGNLSYTEERAKSILYGSYEQGKDGTYLYVNKNNNDIDFQDYNTINGKKIGVCKGQIQEDELKKWCSKHNIKCEIVEFDYFSDCKAALNDGKINAAVDGRIQLDENTDDWDVVFALNTSSFYFGVNQKRHDILKELNDAQKKIIDENPFYNEKVQERYFKPVALATTNLNAEEKKWLEDNNHIIKVGYLEGFLPLCDKDKNGKCKGVAADVFSSIEQKYADENIKFETVSYTDYTAMFEALNNGTIYVAWPAYDDYWNAEQRGFSVTDCVVNTSMLLVYDGKYTDDTVAKIGVINTGSLPKIYANIYYPQSEIHEYDSYDEAISAILKGEVSSVLYVSTTYNVDVTNNEILQKLNMVVLPDSFGISFAVSPNEEALCSIFNKGISVFGEAGVNHSLIINSAVNKEITLKDYFEQHPYIGVGIIIIILLIIVGVVFFMLYKNMSVRIKTSQAEKDVYEKISNSDPLTGLYNRKAVFRKCGELLEKYPEESFVIAHVDMKHFRLYNTFFGDDAGDKLLCDVAELFREISKDYEFWAYGRIEADVYCLFFPFEKEKFKKHFEKTKKYLKEYRTDFLIEPVIGLYYVTDKKIPIEAMFTRASLAAKEVKENSTYDVGIYDEKIEKNLNEKQQIINEMQLAIDEEQFAVYLQPKYSLQDNKMVGTEALVRWIHPTKGIISPGLFIPIFESNGFITILDRYMWEHVCRLLSKWKKEKKPIMPISVNVSRLSMFGSTTVEFLKQLISKYDIDPKYLQLELTESAYMDNPEEMKVQMKTLRDVGFTILLDDFGSGYSSLNTLREIPVDILKLDMKFLHMENDDLRGKIVISSIVKMSKLLKLEVIAEGVEIKSQADYLKSIGCEYVQGFLFARPMPIDEYEKLLNDAELKKTRTNQQVVEQQVRDQHVVEQHVVEQHVVEQHVGEQHVGEQSGDINVIDNKLTENQTKHSHETETRLWECAKNLISAADINAATNAILYEVMKYYNADRAYIFEFDWDKFICSNTYEICAKGVEPVIDTLQEISIEVLNVWVKLFNEKSLIHIKDLNELIGDENRKDEYDILEPQGIKGLIAVPVYSEEKLVGFLGVDNPKNNLDDTKFIESLAFLCVNQSLREKEKNDLQQQSMRDSLTGAYNRKAWEIEQNKLVRKKIPFSIVMIDVDNYKSVNDQFGHQVGDELLKRIVAALNKLFRSNDMIVRYGGDEFIVILENTGAWMEEILTKKIDLLNEILSHPVHGMPGVSVSVGIAFSEDCNEEDLFRNADNALYHVKNSGKRGWHIYKGKND